jgi:hypothetical protein
MGVNDHRLRGWLVLSTRPKPSITSSGRGRSRQRWMPSWPIRACLVVPLKNGDLARVGDFDMFFRARVAHLTDFTGAVFRRAAEIRAAHGFKTMQKQNRYRRQRGAR